MLEKELRTAIALHEQWLRSDGQEGKRANFTGADLRQADLRGLNLSRAVMTGALLERAIFSDAILHETDLTDAKLDYAQFQRADLSRAVLNRASTSGTIFSQSLLSGACFVRVNGINTDFADANIAGALFVKANLPYANFQSSVLSDVSFADASLLNANLHARNLSNANFDNSTLMGALVNSDRPDLLFMLFDEGISDEEHEIKSFESKEKKYYKILMNMLRRLKIFGLFLAILSIFIFIYNMFKVSYYRNDNEFALSVMFLENISLLVMAVIGVGLAVGGVFLKWAVTQHRISLRSIADIEKSSASTAGQEA
jgi:uncharacterized protein YjbI with pentapeptide repeats